MCFSATASFGASVILAGTGAAGISQSTPKARLFSFIPILFAIQQAIEGFQWMAIMHGTTNVYLGYGFIFFAFLLWPVYMPIAFIQMEKNEKRRQYMKLWLGIGCLTSISLLIGILMHPLSIEVVGQHIQYFSVMPNPLIFASVYTLAVCCSGMLSSYFYVRLFSVLVFVFSILSGLIYTEAYVSVWCFFAAVLSVLVVLGVKERASDRG